MGVIFGLEKLKKKCKVNVYTDSQYIVKAINDGWVKKWESKNWNIDKNRRAKNIDLWKRLLYLISIHEDVRFIWIKGHDGHSENEECDKLANKAINSENLLDDDGYNPDEENITAKVDKEGDLCRKCNNPVVKKTPKKKKIKQKQSYYYEYYLYCDKCWTIYFTEDGKIEIQKNDQLFS